MTEPVVRRGAIRKFAASLRFPHLLLLTAVVFVVDLLVPDVIPFADEILLGFLTVILGLWRDRTRPGRDGRPLPADHAGTGQPRRHPPPGAPRSPRPGRSIRSSRI